MAQKRISELPVLTAEPDGTSIIPLVQDGATMSVTFDALKQKMVKEVETAVDTKTDNKLKNKMNLVSNTSMVKLGFTKNSIVSIRDFWSKLYSKFGTNGVINFDWYDVEMAYLGKPDDNIPISGGTFIYTCSNHKPGAWSEFSAIYIGNQNTNIYHIRCIIQADDTVGSEIAGINQLALNYIMDSVKSDLSSVSQKFDDMYKYYPNTTKIIGKWVDGKNIVRMVTNKISSYDVGDMMITLESGWLSSNKVNIPLKAYAVLSNEIVEGKVILSNKVKISKGLSSGSDIKYVVVEYVSY